MMKKWFIAAATALTLCSLGIEPVRAGTIFTDNFDTGASSLWGNEIGNWAGSGGTYDSAFPNNFPNAHSSLPFVLSDFSIDLDINNVENGGVWLRSTEAPGTSIGRTGVLLTTAQGGIYWHIVTDPNNYGDIFEFAPNLYNPGVSDINLHIEVSGNTYSAFLNGASTPVTTLIDIDENFASGQIALYDNSNQTFDNIGVETPDPVPEPSMSILLTLIGAGVVRRVRSRSQQ
ncbi:MAG: PEP-CTERM sorting domain-containing protein [Cyanobacteria bacterium P01_E01_bin.42]